MKETQVRRLADSFPDFNWGETFAEVVGISFAEFNQYLLANAKVLPAYLQAFKEAGYQSAAKKTSFADLLALKLIHRTSLKETIAWDQVNLGLGSPLFRE
ncbi:MAG: hypothetical protein JJT75_03050 [Opitutales bacterium]|nr:hypothetical protein [Opitutales bacterium]